MFPYRLIRVNLSLVLNPNNVRFMNWFDKSEPLYKNQTIDLEKIRFNFVEIKLFDHFGPI